MRVRQLEPPLICRLRGVLNLHDARDRLLLQRFPCVTSRDTSLVCQFWRRDWSRAGERLVEAEPDTQLDARELHRRETRAEQVRGELLDPLHRRPSTRSPT